MQGAVSRRKTECPVDQDARRRKQALCFVDRDNVGQRLRLGLFGQKPNVLDVNGLGPQALELEMLETDFALLPEVTGRKPGVLVYPHEILRNHFP